MLELDYMNSPIDPRTGSSWGNEHRLWYGWEHEPGEEPERAEKVLCVGWSEVRGGARRGGPRSGRRILGRELDERRVRQYLQMQYLAGFDICWHKRLVNHAFPTFTQDLSFGGYHRDDLGKNMVWNDSLNGLELGPAKEVTKGWKAADRFAAYTVGSGTDTLTFVYKVQDVSG